MKFKSGVGAVLDKQNKILGIVENLEDAKDLMFDLYELNLDSIYTLTWVHSPDSPDLTNYEKDLLDKMTHNFYPFPARFTVISEVKDPIDNGSFGRFQEVTYLGLLIGKDKKLEIIKEQWCHNYINLKYMNAYDNYVSLLVGRSYETEDKVSSVIS